jgi:hypothetical protein
MVAMIEQPFDHNGECRYCDELGMHRADCAWLLEMVADHARLQKAAAMLAVGTDDLAVAFDEQQTEIERLRARLQIDPGGSDAIDGLEAAVEMLRAQLDRAKDEIAKLHAALAGR